MNSRLWDLRKDNYWHNFVKILVFAGFMRKNIKNISSKFNLKSLVCGRCISVPFTETPEVSMEFVSIKTIVLIQIQGADLGNKKLKR